MEEGSELPASTPATTPVGEEPTKGVTPDMTAPQILAVAAFFLFVALAWLVDAEDTKATLNGIEYDKLRDLTLVLIAALLPSDAILRYGRSILFSKVEDPDAAKYAPATTTAQRLAFAVYMGVVAAMLITNDIITETEGDRIVEVAEALIIALLPSDAVIRFARARRLSKLPAVPTQKQLEKV